MSGGRYGYICHQITTLADDLEAELERTPAEPSPLARVWSRERRAWIEGEEAAAVLRSVNAERAWLVQVLRAVARAAHDVEWVDSGDYGPGDEVEAIRAVRAVLLRQHNHHAKCDIPMSCQGGCWDLFRSSD